MRTFLPETLREKAIAVAQTMGQPLPKGTTATVQVDACGATPSYHLQATSPTYDIAAASVDMITDPTLGFEPLRSEPCAPPLGPLQHGDAYNSDHAISVHREAVQRTKEMHGAAIARLRAKLAKRGVILEILHLLFSIFWDGARVGSGGESVTGVLGRWENFRSGVLGRGFESIFKIGILKLPKQAKPSAARERAGKCLLHAALNEMIWRQVRASHERPTVVSWQDCRGKLRVALVTLEPLQVIGD